MVFKDFQLRTCLSKVVGGGGEAADGAEGASDLPGRRREDVREVKDGGGRPRRGGRGAGKLSFYFHLFHKFNSHFDLL